ncbi:hypothetical protein C8R44DRAFT_859847 [Mycena epipterygia]|nr:hypothetical protein C8R44DRAFT_859847 [Mycena epipterygia]
MARSTPTHLLSLYFRHGPLSVEASYFLRIKSLVFANKSLISNLHPICPLVSTGSKTHGHDYTSSPVPPCRFMISSTGQGCLQSRWGSAAVGYTAFLILSNSFFFYFLISLIPSSRPSMPLFASSSGVQINGGNFYDVAGDMNVQSSEHLGHDIGALRHGTRPSQDSDRQLSGTESEGRHMGDAKMLPYNISRRPQITTYSNGSSMADDHSESTAMATAYLPSVTIPAQLDSQVHLPPVVDPPTSQDSATRLHQFFGGPYRSTDSGVQGTPNIVPASVLWTPDLTVASHSPWEHIPPEPRTNISGGTFIGGNVNHIERRGEPGLQMLYRGAACDAFHDSAERYPQPKCHPETRTKMLDDLYTWASNDDRSSRVLWLYGPAGAGKSAIAQSFCQKLEAERCLGGCFFFKRGHASRGNAYKLFATIAYQLAVVCPELEQLISQRVEKNPAIIDRSLSIQFQQLIIEPVRQNIPDRPLVVLIDGLDECEGHDVQQEVLRCIGNTAHGQNLPLRFLIASRPEPHISEVFNGPSLGGHHIPVNIEQSFSDVETYFVDEFARILHEHQETMSTISSPWPSPEIIRALVNKSSGYFIYASTVIRFIDDKNFRPTERLAVIMGIKEPDGGSPYAALDQLYTQILSDVPVRPRLLRILTIIAAKFYLTVPGIEELLEWQPGDVWLALRGLHSVIKIGDDNYMTVYHASFPDFLLDPQRSGPFYGGDVQRCTDLALRILKRFSYSNDGSWLNYQRAARDLYWESTIGFVTSVPPSPELVAIFRRFNPGFLFQTWCIDDKGESHFQLIRWLEKFQPLPEDLIMTWEDYYFMKRCDSIWTRIARRPYKIRSRRQVLPDPSPQLVRILHAYALLADYSAPLVNHFLLDIHILLDISAEELRSAVCPLLSVVGEDPESLAQLLLCTLHSTPEFSLVRSDLARGFIRIMRGICSGGMPCRSIWAWGRYMRSCAPADDDLLQGLCDMEITLNTRTTNISTFYNIQGFHDIVQWLKTIIFDPPLELIIRFEHRLKRIIDEAPDPYKYTFDYLETGWGRLQDHRQRREEQWEHHKNEWEEVWEPEEEDEDEEDGDRSETEEEWWSCGSSSQQEHKDLTALTTMNLLGFMDRNLVLQV